MGKIAPAHRLTPNETWLPHDVISKHFSRLESVQMEQYETVL